MYPLCSSNKRTGLCNVCDESNLWKVLLLLNHDFPRILDLFPHLFIHIIMSHRSISCYSEGLGRQGGPQVVSLSDDCVCLAEQNCEYLGVYVVQHELMHVLGWYHEQSRYDRDDYVIINWDNIEPGISQFKQ